MSEREIPASGYDGETRNKILEVATELFALKGYSAVSMRDIAKIVGIKMSSIYYYYDGKEALLEDVFHSFESGYRHYFEWLREQNSKAISLDGFLDNMFNDEFINMQNPLTCFGITLAVKEQHNIKSARKLVFELFYEHSVQQIQADFDMMIERGILPPSDTKTLATTFMFCVLVGNDISIHEHKGGKPPIKSKEMYGNLKNLIKTMLMNGNTDTSV